MSNEQINEQMTFEELHQMGGKHAYHAIAYALRNEASEMPDGPLFNLTFENHMKRARKQALLNEADQYMQSANEIESMEIAEAGNENGD